MWIVCAVIVLVAAAATFYLQSELFLRIPSCLPFGLRVFDIAKFKARVILSHRFSFIILSALSRG